MRYDFTKLARTSEGKALIDYIENEIKKLDKVSEIDLSQSNEAIAADVAGREQSTKVLKKIVKLVKPNESNDGPVLNNNEYE